MGGCSVRAARSRRRARAPTIPPVGFGEAGPKRRVEFQAARSASVARGKLRVRILDLPDGRATQYSRLPSSSSVLGLSCSNRSLTMSQPRSPSRLWEPGRALHGRFLALLVRKTAPAAPVPEGRFSRRFAEMSGFALVVDEGIQGQIALKDPIFGLSASHRASGIPSRYFWMCGPDPPDGISGETGALVGIEVLYGLQKTNIALLDEILQPSPTPEVLAREDWPSLHESQGCW